MTNEESSNTEEVTVIEKTQNTLQSLLFRRLKRVRYCLEALSHRLALPRARPYT